MAVIEQHHEQVPVPSDSAWTWERSLPITPAQPRPVGRGLRVFPALTWWTALVITLMFAVMIIAV